jgi:hypothetical protein
LWIDVRNRSYGIEQDAGYDNTLDGKALNYQMGEDLRVEVGNRIARSTQQTVRRLPVLRFFTRWLDQHRKCRRCELPRA